MTITVFALPVARVLAPAAATGEWVASAYRRHARTVKNAVMSVCALSIVAPSLAFAREDYCITPGTNQINGPATQSLRLLESQSNPGVMAYLNGLWLSTIVSRPTNQVSYLYERFTGNGLYGYTNFVCTLQNTFCRRYDGTGVYAVRLNGSNSFFGEKDVSDTASLNHACIGLGGASIDRNTWVSGTLVRKRVG
jgi:hypothetical protein